MISNKTPSTLTYFWGLAGGKSAGLNFNPLFYYLHLHSVKFRKIVLDLFSLMPRFYGYSIKDHLVIN